MGEAAQLAKTRLRLCAGALLSNRWLTSLLAPGARLHKSVRVQALSTLCLVLDATSDAIRAGQLAELGGEARTAALAAQERLSDALVRSALPALEGLLAIDFPLRRINARGSDGGAEVSAPAESERVGSEKARGWEDARIDNLD